MSEEVNSNDLVMFEGDSGNNDGQRSDFNFAIS